tara:strand:- start:138 stop:479 length:342 start_codon:yes stop_codon:yes gene_type:complete
MIKRPLTELYIDERKKLRIKGTDQPVRARISGLRIILDIGTIENARKIVGGRNNPYRGKGNAFILGGPFPYSDIQPGLKQSPISGSKTFVTYVSLTIPRITRLLTFFAPRRNN